MPSESQLYRHGLTRERYDRLADHQYDRCAICGADEALVIDHDHGCCPVGTGRGCGNCVRGLLCKRCNWMVGYIEKSAPGVFARAVRYILGENPMGVSSGPTMAQDLLEADATKLDLTWSDYCARFGLERPAHRGHAAARRADAEAA